MSESGQEWGIQTDRGKGMEQWKVYYESTVQPRVPGRGRPSSWEAHYTDPGPSIPFDSVTGTKLKYPGLQSRPTISLSRVSTGGES